MTPDESPFVAVGVEGETGCVQGGRASKLRQSPLRSYGAIVDFLGGRHTGGIPT